MGEHSPSRVTTLGTGATPRRGRGQRPRVWLSGFGVEPQQRKAQAQPRRRSSCTLYNLIGASRAPCPYPMMTHLAGCRRQPKAKPTRGKADMGDGVGLGRGRGRLARSNRRYSGDPQFVWTESVPTSKLWYYPLERNPHMKKKILEWGETPWDGMTRGELLREIQRMYSAMRSLYSVVRMHQAGNENHPYFGKAGVAGNALEKGRQILEPLWGQLKNGEEDMFRCFFRYADDLLFDQRAGYTMIGSGWAICPKCGVMLGATGNGETMFGKPCNMGKNDCKGIMRPLTWGDMRKQRS